VHIRRHMHTSSKNATSSYDNPSTSTTNLEKPNTNPTNDSTISQFGSHRSYRTFQKALFRHMYVCMYVCRTTYCNNLAFLTPQVLEPPNLRCYAQSLSLDGACLGDRLHMQAKFPSRGYTIHPASTVQYFPLAR
jgi:hypothetical protein